MTYEEELEWLFTQFPSYQKVGGRAYKAGLGTMKQFDEALGHPHVSFKAVHIAGTNGKGSVSHMLAGALASSGKKVGLYTSPHLIDFRERIKICTPEGYMMIPEQDVYDFLLKWNGFFLENRPSFFEITTAMAFDYFAKQNVDIAIIETGLGGRLDSTNIITPVASIITNIGLEHCKYLGNTLAEIAAEKAGIIKDGVPVIIGEVLPETLPVFQKAASIHHSMMFIAERFNYGISYMRKHGLSVSAEDLDLKGKYQAKNLKTVLCALNAFGSKLDVKGLSHGLLHAGQMTGLHGRWETLREEDGKAKIICDTGHNAHGLKWVFEQVENIRNDFGKIFIIFGVVADKDVESIGKLMPMPSAKIRYVLTNASCERALPVADLAKRLSPFGIEGDISSSVPEALSLADKSASPADLILICGSNFVVAESGLIRV